MTIRDALHQKLAVAMGWQLIYVSHVISAQGD
jgi:hypothetical protein